SDAANRVVLEGDRILLAGRTGTGAMRDFALARLYANGTPDMNFDGDGKLTTDFAGGADEAVGVAVGPGGRVGAAGPAGASGGKDFAVGVYHDDGSPDLGFDGDGKATLDFGGTFDEAARVAVDPSGRIVAAGSTNAGGGLFNFALARFTPAGM